MVQGRTVLGAKGSQQALTAGCTPLHAAAFRGDLGIVQAMLQVMHRLQTAGRLCVSAEGQWAPTHRVTTKKVPWHSLAIVSKVTAASQAHADGMGRWNSGAAAADGQRDWENDGRLDLRSVTSTTRQLPYHLARQMNHGCCPARPGVHHRPTTAADPLTNRVWTGCEP